MRLPHHTERFNWKSPKGKSSKDHQGRTPPPELCPQPRLQGGQRGLSPQRTGQLKARLGLASNDTPRGQFRASKATRPSGIQHPVNRRLPRSSVPPAPQGICPQEAGTHRAQGVHRFGSEHDDRTQQCNQPEKQHHS